MTLLRSSDHQKLLRHLLTMSYLSPRYEWSIVFEQMCESFVCVNRCKHQLSTFHTSDLMHVSWLRTLRNFLLFGLLIPTVCIFPWSDTCLDLQQSQSSVLLALMCQSLLLRFAPFSFFQDFVLFLIVCHVLCRLMQILSASDRYLLLFTFFIHFDLYVLALVDFNKSCHKRNEVYRFWICGALHANCPPWSKRRLCKHGERANEFSFFFCSISVFLLFFLFFFFPTFCTWSLVLIIM